MTERGSSISRLIKGLGKNANVSKAAAQLAVADDLAGKAHEIREQINRAKSVAGSHYDGVDMCRALTGHTEAELTKAADTAEAAVMAIVDSYVPR